MGSIYRPKYRDRRGMERTSAIWWIQYYRRGKKIRESARTTDATEARALVKQREGDATRGRTTRSMERKVLFAELAELVEKDYKLNRYRSLVDIELRHRLHILPFFGNMRANRITEADIDDYILLRRREGAKNSTINRELVTIKRAFNLGIQKHIVSDRPHITLLDEDNVRQGFFEREQYLAIRRHLPKHVQAIADFAYVTGWRRNEILGLQWRQVDFKAGTVRLEPGATKNREARQFPFTSDLREVLERQKAKTDALAESGRICPWVFHHDGKPVGEFKRSWTTACIRAGVPGRLFHDFRRTAVRNLVRAGIPERVAMTMTGHKTRSVFERYNIVSEADLREAAARLERFSGKDTDKDTPQSGRGRIIGSVK